jgi:hypothetical protein
VVGTGVEGVQWREVKALVLYPFDASPHPPCCTPKPAADDSSPFSTQIIITASPRREEMGMEAPCFKQTRMSRMVANVVVLGI